MNEENTKHPGAVTTSNQAPDVAAQLAKIQQHLAFLEKKLDTLLAQSQGNGNSFQRREFKPRRDFGGREGFSKGPRHDRHDRQDRRDNREPRENFGNFEGANRAPREERSFGKPRKFGNQGFFHKKKNFSRSERD